jgi:hypothetical protein
LQDVVLPGSKFKAPTRLSPGVTAIYLSGDSKPFAHKY